MDAAAKLKTWRVERDYTLEDVGRVVGCDFTTISKIENRWQHPGLGLALKLEKAFCIPVETWSKSRLKRSPKRKRAKARDSDAPPA